MDLYTDDEYFRQGFDGVLARLPADMSQAIEPPSESGLTETDREALKPQMDVIDAAGAAWSEQLATAKEIYAAQHTGAAGVIDKLGTIVENGYQWAKNELGGVVDKAATVTKDVTGSVLKNVSVPLALVAVVAVGAILVYSMRNGAKAVKA